MPSLGPAEILVILVVALLVFGPDKMPDMARQAGRAFRQFRRVQQHLRTEISGALADVAPPAPSPVTDAVPGGDAVPTLPPKDAHAAPSDTSSPTSAAGPGAVAPPPAAPDRAPDRAPAPPGPVAPTEPA